MKQKTQAFGIRLLCWILAGLMALGSVATLILAILGKF